VVSSSPKDLDGRGEWVGVRRTGVCVPFVLVMRAFLFADELLVHDFFKLDHLGGVVVVSV